MSWEPGTPNTATVLAAMAPESVRVIWQKGVDIFDQQEDFFGQFEGKSKSSPIWVLDQIGGGNGLEFRITSMGGVYNKGKSGEALFLDEDDFAKLVINTNILKADFLRNAISNSDRTDEFMGMVNELSNGFVEQFGKWMGRERSARLAMTYILRGGPENLLYPGTNTSEDTLTATDGMSYDDFLVMSETLKPLGSAPCEVATINGNPVYKYMLVGTTPGLFSLKQDSSYQTILRSIITAQRYDENPIIRGGYVDLDGHRIMEFNPVNPDGYGWAGSWFNAKAYLGEAITAGTSLITLKGGGSAEAAAVNNVEYFRFFPNAPFEFMPNDIEPADITTRRYIRITNPRGAVTAANPDPGKIGIYSYQVNSGYQITLNQRLASVQNGPVALNTVGSVTYNSGVWAGFSSMTHPIGSTITLCNAKGQHIGDSVMFGAGNMLRGYGSQRNRRGKWRVDDFVDRTYVMGIFGQKLRKNVNGQNPGFVRMRHALAYPALGGPVIT